MDDPRPSRHLYAQLRADIVAGKWAPGTRLHLDTLRREYSAGRGSVQTALQLLADDGLVVRYVGMGWYVKSPGELPGLLLGVLIRSVTGRFSACNRPSRLSNRA